MNLEIGQKADASDVHPAVNAQPIWRLDGTLQPIWPDAPRLTSEQTALWLKAFVPDVYKQELNTRGLRFRVCKRVRSLPDQRGPQRLGIEIFSA